MYLEAYDKARRSKSPHDFDEVEDIEEEKILTEEKMQRWMQSELKDFEKNLGIRRRNKEMALNSKNNAESSKKQGTRRWQRARNKEIALDS